MRYLIEKEPDVTHIQEHDRVGTPLRVSLCGRSINMHHSSAIPADNSAVCQECQAMVEHVHDEATTLVELAVP